MIGPYARSVNCSACGATNPPGMRYCGMCGRAFVTGAAERERRRVSVVFVDLTGFSTLTHGLDPEELRDLADHVLTEVAGVIENYDGHVDAFRGDGLIAVFGAPHSHPDDPYRAVVSAEASLEAIERVGRARGVDLRGRAGVTTGVVIAGAVGSGRVREYTVMGSTVNLASRLENAAGPGEVWVGDETYEATRHQLTYQVVEDVHLPGFPNVTSVHRLVSSKRRDLDPYGKVAFVGRERELTQLLAWHRSVCEGQRPRQVWLQGEAGSGKTRLLREFAARVSGARVVWLRSDPRRGSPGRPSRARCSTSPTPPTTAPAWSASVRRCRTCCPARRAGTGWCSPPWRWSPAPPGAASSAAASTASWWHGATCSPPSRGTAAAPTRWWCWSRAIATSPPSMRSSRG
jgi:class 3 adenylate cyclase